jgi:hypothetical protein
MMMPNIERLSKKLRRPSLIFEWIIEFPDYFKIIKKYRKYFTLSPLSASLVCFIFTII